jgi:hypothetical protein
MTFVTANGQRWMKHTVGLDIDYVAAHLEEPALENFEELELMNKLLVVRAVTELSVCRFRQTRHDPDYEPNEYGAWSVVIQKLIGDKGLERLGI